MPTFRETIGKKIKIFFYEEDKKKAKQVVEINQDSKIIKIIPRSGSFFLQEIIISGFKNLPSDIVKETGTLKAGLIYYLRTRFQDKNVFHIEIAKEKKNSFRKVKNKGYNLILNYGFVREIIKKFNNIRYESSINCGEVFDIALNKCFPKKFVKSEVKYLGRNQARRLVKSLNEDSITFFNNNEAQQVVDFFVKLITKRSKVQKFFNLAKVRVDEIALESIIDKFENLINNNTSESKISDFLIENLFVIDSKYTLAIPEINLVLGGQRRVDFGLVDSNRYLDIFEIKRPNTRLLSQKQDRGNYYWHEQAVKAITQIEKYLYQAESKKYTLLADIKRQRGNFPESIKMVRPRAVLIIGNQKQLDNEAKEEDFKVLKASLKNIEIILYDELLQGIKNQQNKIFLRPSSKK